MIHIYYIGFILLSTFGAILLYVKNVYNHFAKNGIPHVKPRFPYGSIKGMLETEHMATMVQRFYYQFKGKGLFGGLYFLIRPAILVTDLEFIKKVLIKDFTSFEDRGGYYNKETDPLSAHLFSLNGKEWRKLRSKLSPTFTSGKMKFMYPTIIDVANRFKTVLKEKVGSGNGEILEVKEVLARFTTDVIGTCAFGIECNSLTDPNATFLNMGRKILTEPRHSTIVAFLIDSFPKVSTFFGIKVTSDEVSNFFIKLVEDTVNYREQNNIHRNDFMDILIRLKNEDIIRSGDDDDTTDSRLTLNEIAAQAFVFFLAGFETSSTAMTWSLFELALNKDVQTKAREEIKAVLAKHNNELTYEAMTDMQFIDQVLNESLRKYPPVAVLFRSPNKSYYVPEINYTIPKDTPIWIPIHALQNDPEFFPEPEKFDVNRFSPDAMKTHTPLTFLPFGDGPRNCIGLRFGMMQARVGLATMLLNFEFSICSETNLPKKLAVKEFIMSPENGMSLKLRAIT